MGRFLLRVAPLFVCACGAVVADLGWLSYLLGWQAAPYSELHSLEHITILLIVGIASGYRPVTEFLLRRFNEDKNY
jgi:hypothetical protein